MKDSLMPQPTDARRLLEPVEDIAGVGLPPRFGEALQHVRATVACCERAQIPNDTLIAALMAELMPRLVGAYAPSGAIAILTGLADEISATADPSLSIRRPSNLATI